MDANIPEEESPYTLNNLNPKVFGPTKYDGQKIKDNALRDLNSLLETNAIEAVPKDKKAIEKWFIEQVENRVDFYMKKDPAIKSAYENLRAQANARLAQKAGGSKRRKSARIFRKSIRKCKKCKRNYRKSKKSKQA